mgnify:CR=1 FL=1
MSIEKERQTDRSCIKLQKFKNKEYLPGRLVKGTRERERINKGWSC